MLRKESFYRRRYIGTVTLAVVSLALLTIPLATRQIYAEEQGKTEEQLKTKEQPPVKKKVVKPIRARVNIRTISAKKTDKDDKANKTTRTEKTKEEIAKSRAVARRTAVQAALLRRSNGSKADEKATIEDRATHRETGAIVIPQGDEKLPIHTFCVDSKDRLLATCGGERLKYNRQKESSGFEIEQITEPASIKVLSPKGDLLDTWKLDVTPQSINVAPDGTIFVGGAGKLIKLNPDGKVLKTAKTPNFDQLPPLPDVPEEEPPVDTSKMTDEEKEKHEALQKEKKEKIKSLTKKRNEYTKQMSDLYKKLLEAQKAKDKDEQNRWTGEMEKLQGPFQEILGEIHVLTITKRQLAMQARSIAIRKRNVPGIAATKDDLFVVCSPAKGYGYEVWRTDHNFENPKRIVERLSGCCSQMDIQAHDGKLWVAENSRKQVRCFDRDGKELAKWGADERDDAQAGFGSCCNPMNLRLDAEGYVYTSESGPGTIKKFDKDGNFIDYIGKAKIVPGCKHVAVDMSKDLTRFYMLDVSSSQILVFEDLNRITTHEQTTTISIPQDEEKLPIHSFCLDKKGRLLATCGGPRLSFKRTRLEKGGLDVEIIEENDPASVKVLDADGKLLDTWKLDFMPRAINVAPDGLIYAAGQGRIAKLDESGKVLKIVDAPNVAELGPIPELPKEEKKELTEAEKAAKQQEIDELIERRRETGKEMREHREELGKTTDEDEKIKIAGNLETLQNEYRQLNDEYQKLVQSPRAIAANLREAAMHKRLITGIAVSKKDIFVTGYPAKGHGFSVWRMDRDFANPKEIVKGLRGCCSQLDIQCHGEQLWIAENSRKKVSCYDRDGKQLLQFGENERNAKNSGYGFGSCCNPMNLRFNAAGDVYTAEASVGRLRRFSADGKFIETVAQLKIVPGCKHVAIGVTGDGNRIYMLDITRSQIVVVDRKR